MDGARFTFIGMIALGCACGEGIGSGAPPLPPTQSLNVVGLVQAPPSAITLDTTRLYLDLAHQRLDAVRAPLSDVVYPADIGLAVARLAVPTLRDDGVWKWSAEAFGIEATLLAEPLGAFGWRLTLWTLDPTWQIPEVTRVLTGVWNHERGHWWVHGFGVEDPVVDITWKANDQIVVEQRVRRLGDPEDFEFGDEVFWERTDSQVIMEIHDARDPFGTSLETTLRWNEITGAGSLTQQTLSYCWDGYTEALRDLPACSL